MKNQFNIVCRGSWLSLAQATVFAEKVTTLFPGIQMNTIIRQTEGDKNQSTPLHLVEGKDFFTKDIQEFLKSGGADFAVHSMKDVSSEEFFGNHEYALIDRDDIRDVAIFNENVLEQLQQGATIRIGTSSPRRSVMAVEFLQKALPWLGTGPRLEALPVRGNVDKRLRQLQDGKFDALILASAGLNRLLRFEPAQAAIHEHLRHKKIMLLPLFECPPAAGQGAIVAETAAGNEQAVQILKAVNNPALKQAIQCERKFADKYGYGCSKEFGVFHLQTAYTAFTYAAGQDEWQRPFSEWDMHINGLPLNGPIFSAEANMQHFFEYRFLPDTEIDNTAKAVFIASHKAVHNAALVRQCKQRRVWAAGVKTWILLAQKGIWVEGCADGLGMEILRPVWEAPLFQLPVSDILVISHTAAVPQWRRKGWRAEASYQLQPALDETVKKQLQCAGAVFWTSFQQYELCRPYLRNGTVHICPAGKTAQLLSEAGLQPVIFPTIKAFQQWKQSVIPSHSAA